MELLNPRPLVVALLRRVARGVMLALLPAAALAADANSLEYAVKANYLYKFADYVAWPATAFASPNSPVALCLVGDDPFGAVLDSAVRDQHIAGRQVVVRRLKNIGRDSVCQILFVGGADPQRAQILATVRGSAVLTVTDRQDREGAAGIIDFVIRDNRVRFTIDEEAAARNGLAISSKLLRLALSLHRPGQP